MRYRRHETKRMLAPWGWRVRIDCGIAKLVRLLWNLGLGTSYSCEDHDGEVEIGVPRAEIAAWFWAYAHADEKPPREQVHAYRDQIGQLLRPLVEYHEAYERERLRLQEELEQVVEQAKAQGEEINWDEFSGALPRYECKSEELRISPHWRWTIHPNLIYCKFPVERLAHVEANCESVLRWKRPAGRNGSKKAG